MAIHPLNNVLPGTAKRNTPAAIDGGGGVKLTRARYSFVTEGGAISAINLLPSGFAFPAGAIIEEAFINVLTIPVGAGASISLGIETATDLLAVTAITASPWSTTGKKALIPVFTAATMLETTVARNLVATISAAALTAGIFDIYVHWIDPN